MALSVNTKALTSDQEDRLFNLLNSVCDIHGSDPLPTLQVRPVEFIHEIAVELKCNEHIELNDVRLNGGAASYVVADKRKARNSYNDLDILFCVDFNPSEAKHRFDEIRDLVHNCIVRHLPSDELQTFSKEHFTRYSASIGRCYVQKMFKTSPHRHSATEPTTDCWSLLSLCNHYGQNLELKFVQSMSRQYEFSTDSFQIILPMEKLLAHHILEQEMLNSTSDSDPILSETSSETSSSDSFELDSSDTSQTSTTSQNSSQELPLSHNIVSSSLRSDFDDCIGIDFTSAFIEGLDEALVHLNNKLICIERPEMIRGGGLLKYCHLRCRGFHTVQEKNDLFKMENYMVNRFVIDYDTPIKQWNSVTGYLNSHFTRDLGLGSRFLYFLHNLLQSSNRYDLAYTVGNVISLCPVPPTTSSSSYTTSPQRTSSTHHSTSSTSVRHSTSPTTSKHHHKSSMSLKYTTSTNSQYSPPKHSKSSTRKSSRKHPTTSTKYSTTSSNTSRPPKGKKKYYEWRREWF